MAKQEKKSAKSKGVTLSAAEIVIEHKAVADGNLTYLNVDAARAAHVKAILENSPIKQDIIAEAPLEGRVMLITRGNSVPAEVQRVLQENGEHVVPPKEDKGAFQPWKVRGWLSVGGQFLQMFSAAKSTKGLDTSTLLFAGFNQTANAFNIGFGAQRPEDVHQLYYLKSLVNDTAQKYAMPGTELPSPENNHAALRRDPQKTKPFGERMMDWFRRNSVSFGEIGLRYAGAFSLVFPIFKKEKIGEREVEKEIKDSEGNVTGTKKVMEPVYRTRETTVKVNGKEGVETEEAKTKPIESLKHWKDAFQLVLAGGKENYRAAFNKIKNNDGFDAEKKKDAKNLWERFNAEGANFKAGTAYLIGKTIALTSKTPDPYAPKKTGIAGAIDFVREQVTFRLASVVEATAAAYLAIDRFRNPNRKIRLEIAKSKENPTGEVQDFVGGIGGTMFAIAQGIRLFAPFGVKQVNMPELDAHITENLAKVPPEKIPHMMAEIAAQMTQHFKGKVHFADLYTQLMEDLYTYHHIATPIKGQEKQADLPLIQSIGTQQNTVELPTITPYKPAQASLDTRHAPSGTSPDAALAHSAENTVPVSREMQPQQV